MTDPRTLERKHYHQLEERAHEKLAEMAKEIEEILVPLLDGTLDPGDLETIAEKWWNLFGPLETEAVKKEVEIHRRLAKLYERLADAPEGDLVAYARMRVNAKCSGQAPLLQLLADTYKSED